MFLVDDLIFSPVSLTIWLGRRIQEAADGERKDDTQIRAEMMENQELWMAGEMTDLEYQAREDALLALLEEARRQRAGSGP